MQKLKIIFAGTPKFAIPCLQGLIDSQHTVQAVFTQPDRPSGRGKKIVSSPVKELALAHKLQVHQPEILKSDDIYELFKEYNPDLFIVVAYGLIIPAEILKIPTGGAINVHASLLPKLRGAAPIQYSILNGDDITGVSIMQMDKGLDTGDVLLQKSIDILPEDNASSLATKLSILGCELLQDVLQSYLDGSLIKEKQDDSLATYAPKIDKKLSQINWNTSAISINLLVRAINPSPVAFCYLDDVRIRVFSTQVLPECKGEPGTIIGMSVRGIDVATNDGCLRITECQLPGKKVINAKECFNAYSSMFRAGNVFR